MTEIYTVNQNKSTTKTHSEDLAAQLDRYNLSCTEVARMLHLTAPTVHRWGVTGKHHFPRPLRIGNFLRFREDEIRAWIATRLAEVQGGGDHAST